MEGGAGMTVYEIMQQATCSGERVPRTAKIIMGALMVVLILLTVQLWYMWHIAKHRSDQIEDMQKLILRNQTDIKEAQGKLLIILNERHQPVEQTRSTH